MSKSHINSVFMSTNISEAFTVLYQFILLCCTIYDFSIDLVRCAGTKAVPLQKCDVK